MEEKISLVVLVDGARPEVVNHLMERGMLPNIRDIAQDGSHTTASSTFPTTTGCAHIPFLTGRFAGDCNLPGVRWFENGRTRSYFTFGKTMNHDLDPGAKLIFDYTTSASIFSPIYRGADYSIKLIGHPISHIFNNWLFFDTVGFKLAKRALLKKRYRFLFLALYSVDELSHRRGCDSPSVLNAYRVIDHEIGKLKDMIERTYSDYQLFIVSDHGLTDTYRHIDLVNVIRSLGLTVRSYPFNFNLRQDIFVGESGNSMAHVYFTGGCSPQDETVIHLLKKTEGIDLILKQDEAIHIHRKDSEAIVEKNNGRFRYECVKGDPLHLEERAGRWLNEKQWYLQTIKTPYPDSIVQISQIFNSPRSGDLIITAENGYDLRVLEFPEHKASHGNLIKDHMLVPVISNQQLKPARTIDIFDYALNFIRG